ncbi:MAG: hypothetical protein J4452_01145 [Candidatus Aenigmarchaeota archaeon]|nr:hypothetical protein [Candidatus Aenigmarchaeota archaeon]
MTRVKEIEPKIWTIEELLSNNFQTFGYFANLTGMTRDQVITYFENRTRKKRDVQIKREYVKITTPIPEKELPYEISFY